MDRPSDQIVITREVVRDDFGIIGTRAVLRGHAFDPSYRGSAAMARCVLCGGRREAPQHRSTGAKR